MFDGEFGPAVGVCGVCLVGFGDELLRVLGHSVDSRGGTEDETGDVVTRHGAEEVHCSTDVDGPVVQWLFDTFWSGFESGKVDDGPDWVGCEDFVEEWGVMEGALVEGDGAGGDLRDAGEGFWGGVGEVVEDDDVVGFLEEFEDGVGADVACSACDEDVLSGGRRRHLVFLVFCFSRSV